MAMGARNCPAGNAHVDKTNLDQRYKVRGRAVLDGIPEEWA